MDFDLLILAILLMDFELLTLNDFVFIWISILSTMSEPI